MLIFIFQGINDQQEATKYIDQAKSFITGSGNFTWSNLFYAGYTGLHVLLSLAGLPPKAMYAVQLLLSALSVYYFTKILCIWITSRLTIIFSAILYSTCFIIHQWVSYLWTDYVFAILVVISIYYLLVQERGRTNKIIFWFLLIVFPFFRPVGFLFAIVSCLYWLFTSPRKHMIKILISVIYVSLIGLLVHKSINESPRFFYPYHNSEANVICGYPSNLLQYQEVPYQEGMSIFSYFWKNPGMATRLFLYRFFKVFSMTRPYFSKIHNLALTMTTLIYYIPAVVGLIKIISRREREKYFLFAGCLVFSIPSIVFCVDWSGRFSMPVFCFILLLAGIGADHIIGKLKHKRTNTLSNVN